MSGSAEKVYSELELIRKSEGGITPVAVVEKAKEKDSALHRHFEWDDGIAAGKYRIVQARKVIQSIEVIHRDAPKVAARVYSVTTQKATPEKPEPTKIYQSTEEALKDPVMRDEILGNAIRDAIAFRRKYSALQELSQVFASVDEFLVNFGG